MKAWIKSHLIVPALLLFWGVLLISNPAFRNATVYSGILREGSMYAVCGIGMTFAIITGGLDLSIASQIALGSVVFTKVVGLICPGIPAVGLIVASLLVLVLGSLMGLCNGLLVTRLRLPPFIATLATMNLYRGLAQWVSDKPITLVSLGEDYAKFTNFATAEFIGIPLFFPVMIVLGILGTVLLRKTSFGRHVLELGNSRSASLLAGVDLPHTETMVYVLTGLFTGLTSLMMTANLGSSNYGVPTGTEFTVISAVVLGGTALAGGSGSIFNTIVASIFLATISTALTTYGVGNNVYGIFRGAILVVAFSLYTLRGYVAKSASNARIARIVGGISCGVLLVAVIILGIFRGGGAVSGDDRPVFGWSVYDLANPFFIPMDEGVREGCEAAGVRLLPTHDQKGDANEMVTGISALIAQGIDALLVSPCSPESMGAIMSMAKKASIPVVVLDIGTGGAKVDAFLRSDMFGGGVLAGQYFLETMESGKYPQITSKNVAIIKCETSATYAITRGEGFKSAVVPGGYKVVEEQHGNSSKNEAYSIMKDYLVKHRGDLAAVFCENDEMALGALAAVEASGYGGKVLIYGFDGNADAKAAIKEGKLAGTVAQDSYKIGRMGAEIGAKLQKSEPIEASERDADGNKVFLVPVSMVKQEDK